MLGEGRNQGRETSGRRLGEGGVLGEGRNQGRETSGRRLGGGGVGVEKDLGRD